MYLRCVLVYIILFNNSCLYYRADNTVGLEGGQGVRLCKVKLIFSYVFLNECPHFKLPIDLILNLHATPVPRFCYYLTKSC